MVDAPTRRFYRHGRSRAAQPGDTALTALARGGLPSTVRSNRYHRPRGPACGVGFCTGCLVRVNGVLSVRACRHPLENGDRIDDANGWPTARFDLLAALDRLLPGGIDTLHGFRRPAFATPVYQWFIRHLAGYGPLPTATPVAPAPPVVLDRDVVIIGAGRSGHVAAARLVAAGVHPLLLDRRLSVEEVPGAEVRPRTTVTFLPPPDAGASPSFRLLGFEEPSRGVTVSARQVVVATGGYDASLLFGQNDRPGVFTADGALALREAGPRPAFRRAVVFGGEDRARTVLDAVGDRVAAVVAPGEIRPEVVRAASDRNIPLYPRSLLVRADGRARVRAVELKPRGGGAPFTVAADAVILAHRRLPHPQLFFQVGAKTAWRAGTGAYYPVVDGQQQTTVPGLFAVGSAAGVLSSDSAESGERAAAAILGTPVAGPELARVDEGGLTDLEGYYRELLHEPLGPRPILCPCEDVLLREVQEAHERGYRGVEVIKRYTSLGTGLCQGRYCLPDALLLLSILEGRPPADVGFITQRPPVVPTPLEALASLKPAVPAEEAA